MLELAAVKERTAAAIGFLLVPVIPATTVVAISILHPIASHSDLSTIASALAVTYLSSLNAALVIGLPSFLVLRFLKLVRWWSALAVGCGIGALSAVVLPLHGRGSSSDFVIDSIVGGVSAIVFWAIWKMSRDARVARL